MSADPADRNIAAVLGLTQPTVPAARRAAIADVPSCTDLPVRGQLGVLRDDKDRVWLSEFGANAVVPFEPEKEHFEVFPSDRPNANIRQMLGWPGEGWAPELGTDRLVVYRTGSDRVRRPRAEVEVRSRGFITRLLRIALLALNI